MYNMGAIQKAISGAANAALVGAATAKHASDQKEQQQEQGYLAKEQYHEAKADLTELESQSIEAEKTLQEKTAISDTLANKKPGGKGNTKKALEEKRAAALTEKEAAQRAFDTLSDKMEAKRAMILRAQMIMKRTGIGE